MKKESCIDGKRCREEKEEMSKEKRNEGKDMGREDRDKRVESY